MMNTRSFVRENIKAPMRNVQRLFIIFYLFLFFQIQTAGQSFPVQTYTLETGLNTNYINGVTQDKQGCMWFATEYGVSVYDSHTWKNYSDRDGLPRNEYFLIKADSNNNIIAVPYWSGSRIAIFKNNKWTLIDELPQLNTIYKNFTSFDFIYENNKQILYFGTNEGVFLYKDKKWSRISQNEGLIDDRVNTVKSFQNKLYVCTENGLSVIHDGKVDNSLNSVINITSKKIKSIEFESVNNSSAPIIWLLGNKWIGKIQNQKFNLVTPNNKMITEFPTQKLKHICFLYDKIDRIYYGNEVEMFYLEKSTGKVITINQDNKFTTSGSSAIFIDRESNLWFTSYRGIDKVSNFCFQNFFKENGLLENEVASAIEVRPGYYIFGHNHGITILKEGKFSTITLTRPSDKNYSVSRIMDLCKDRMGNIWIAGSELGVGKMGSSREISWMQYKTVVQINSVITDIHGTLWVGSDTGLFKISEDHSNLILINDKEFLNIRKIFSDADGTIYGACVDGLAIYKKGVFTKLSVSKLQFGNSIYAVQNYIGNKKFLGTSNGLYILENGFIKKFRVNNFTIDKKVFFITNDGDNNYWFGTNDGIIKWDGKTARRFSLEDGLAGRETNRSAYILDSFGKVWVGTDRGLSCYLPQYDIPIKPPVIKSIEVEDSKGVIHDLANSFETSQSENSFIFQFRAISFINEKFIHYKVKLEGLDSIWTEIGTNNYIRYTNLNPGNYKFLVRAKNLDGDWGLASASDTIIILNPFYKRWWFILIFVGVIGVILYMIQNYISEVKYTHKLEKEVLLRTAALKKSEEDLLQLNAMKDKFFSIVAHDLKSPFQGLLGISNVLAEDHGRLSDDEVKNISFNIYKTTKNLYTLIEQLLGWAQLQTKRMECNIEKLVLQSVVIDVFNLISENAEEKSIEVQNRITNDVIVSADVRMLDSILTNLISNAIKFTSKGGKISISSTYRNNLVEICVNDTGVGIDKEKIDKLF
ncbi:MAG: hypothetical protein FIA82_02625 [Melioribacter sp.]|nr:hypothetical protein [Melioribacter sp.]